MITKSTQVLIIRGGFLGLLPTMAFTDFGVFIEKPKIHITLQHPKLHPQTRISKAMA